MQPRPPTGGGMDMSGMEGSGLTNMQGLSMSPMATNPAMAANSAMMMQPTLQRAYSGGAPMPYSAYGAGAPMSAPPITPTSQQQQQLMLQLQQAQGKLQQQAMQLHAMANPTQSQYSQQSPPQRPMLPPPPAPAGSPPNLKRSSSDMPVSDLQDLRMQQMMQPPAPGKAAFQRSSSTGSSPSSQRKEATTGTFQRSTSNGSSISTSSGHSSKRNAQSQLTPEQTQLLLSQCNVADRTIYVAHQLMGGSSINGFLKATAAAQRVKKSAAQRLKKQKARKLAAAAAKTAEDSSVDAEKQAEAEKRKRGLSEQQQEEELKLETMNVRTTKKIRQELIGGMAFCSNLHTTILSILKGLDPTGTHPLPLGVQASPQTSAPVLPSSPKPRGQPTTNPSTPGDSNGSTLRKLRKREAKPPSTTPTLDEFDEARKRLYSKKEHAHRVVEVLRFRALKQGDYVAARVSSRDLWILARVLKDYNALDMPLPEFLKLSQAKRDSLFREKVLIKDVEEKDRGSSTSVARQLILPLPRSFAEAAEWGSRCKKGTRVYAMYPMTTSLYSATVIDNTTYCREVDDIIVVEFDGDDPDATTGALRQCHIPARFVTAIPREFPASAITSKKKRSSSSVKGGPSKGGAASGSSSKASSSSKRSSKKSNSKSQKRIKSDEALNAMINEMAHGSFTPGADLEKFENDFGMTDFSGGAPPPPQPLTQSVSAPAGGTPPMPPNAALYRNTSGQGYGR